jgi:tryptophanyl-tRNA synthetase
MIKGGVHSLATYMLLKHSHTTILTNNSQVPAHSELMWILSCTASVGYLSRMTQWKVSVPDETNQPRS